MLSSASPALSTIDHETSLWLVIGARCSCVGVGVGLSMQNLMLVLQNTVPLHELGAASGALTFFRSLGGTIGVSVLGAILANQVADRHRRGPGQARHPGHRLRRAPAAPSTWTPCPSPSGTIVRAAYGDATGHIFLVSVGIAVVGLVAALFLPRVRLRDTLDLAQERRRRGAGRRPLRDQVTGSP